MTRSLCWCLYLVLAVSMVGCAAADKSPVAGIPAEAVGAAVTAPVADDIAPPATDLSMDKVSCTEVSKDLPLEERCAAAGAVVHEFPNTCVGRCSAIEEVAMCGQAFTRGCKCPDGQCIDDKTGCCRAIRK